MAYKSVYYKFSDINSYSVTSKDSDTNGRFIQIRNVSSPVYDIVTNEIIGRIVYVTNLNYLDTSPGSPGYLYITCTIYLNDGSYTYSLAVENTNVPPVSKFPDNNVYTVISTASGAYFSSIGNPVAIDVDNVKNERVVTILL
jgi:hypothetical protein